MTPEIFNKANKIWTKLTENAEDKELEFSLEIHKRLLSFFQVGDYFYYVFSVKDSTFELVSKEIVAVLGYEPEEINVPFLLSKIHPEDQPWFLNFENKVGEFFGSLSLEQIPNYKVRYDFRIRSKKGDYIRVLQQVVAIQYDDNKRILKTFGVLTDITHIKDDGLPVLSFIGLNGEPSYVGVKVKDIFSTTTLSLTRREREVLTLLIEGKKSEEISRMLYISKQTVDSHRKNLLKKTNCINTASLTSMAVKKGWV